jgi:peptide deformylase
MLSVPKEILEAVAEPVSDPDEARAIVRKLLTACRALKGCVGLAAPQIGISKAVAVVHDPISGAIINLVNPRILEESDQFIHHDEGCMSFLGRRWNVPRFKSIKIENYSPWPIEDSMPVPAQDVWNMTGGRLVRRDMSLVYDNSPETWGGVVMVAVQHEIDHLMGICLPWKVGAEEITSLSFTAKKVEGFDGLNRGGDAFQKVISAKTGRNDPCPCGKLDKNGKPMKFKKCCQKT